MQAKTDNLKYKYVREAHIFKTLDLGCPAIMVITLKYKLIKKLLTVCLADFSLDFSLADFSLDLLISHE